MKTKCDHELCNREMSMSLVALTVEEVSFILNCLAEQGEVIRYLREDGTEAFRMRTVTISGDDLKAL